MTQFHVGQKVVCIDAKERLHEDEEYIVPGLEIEEGKVYTIRSVGFDEFRKQDAIVRLFEIYREPGGDETEESGFFADRFRPVVTRKTSIEIFKAMLNNEPQKVSA